MGVSCCEWFKSLLKDDDFCSCNRKSIRRLIALAMSEMLGVALFITLGCGDVVRVISGSEGSNHLTTILTFASAIAVSVMVFSPISAIINPALNASAVLLGAMSLPKALYLTVFQFLGGILGIWFIRAVTPNIKAQDPFCVVLPNKDIGVGLSMLVEFVSTAILTLSFCHCLDKRQSRNTHLLFAKWFFIILAISLPMAKYSCSMNPARSFGPALLANHLEYIWLYWAAQYSAVVLATLFYRLVFEEWDEKDEAEL